MKPDSRSEPLTIVADSPKEAFRRIRQQLGPQAVVLSVRSLPRAGLARFWQRPRVEVRAHASPPAGPADNTLGQLLETIRRLNQELPGAPTLAPVPGNAAPQSFPTPPAAGASSQARSAAVGGIEELVAFGLLPEQARVVARPGADPRELLLRAWRKPAAHAAKLHAFVGAPGVGKTTVLCKWLAQVVLLGGQTARLWRLDGRSANTSECLNVYADILSVPLERGWSQPPADLDIGFIDMPGVDWRDPVALQERARLLHQCGDVQTHLVLNAAYESSLLLEQVTALGALGPADIIITHLDEEPRWGKLWNLVVGTPFPLRFLSVGHNVPGTFQQAAPMHLL